MILALACGAGVGAGLWLTARGLLPTRPSLASSLAALRQLPGPAPIAVIVEPTGVTGRISRPVADSLARQLPGLIFPALRRDLTVLARSPARHLAEKITLALVGLLLVPAAAAVLALGGISVPLALPVWAAFGCAIGGFFIPDLGVHAEATARRRDFRYALGSFLDLVVIGLAGGGGVETALSDAASIGGGWAFEHLRRALATAQLTRETPWTTLAQLGRELGVADLTELAASVGLAGAEGAKVRASLAAKAASLRAHQLAEADGAAQAATERMSLPVVLLFAAFLIFIGFPAIERVLTGL
ncbi:MAG: type II secretion system F family protein [Mycobacteriales bacterium]